MNNTEVSQKTWLMKLKKRIGIDETQPIEQIKVQYKARVNWFMGLTWLFGMTLIWVIPEDIMQYVWARHFVSIMGNIVPMVDGLEQIRLYGSDDPYKAHLTVLPHISFYYAVLWFIGLLCMPYMFWLVKGNFIYNKDSNLIGIKTYIKRYEERRFFYYFSLLIVLLVFCFIFIRSEMSMKWFALRYVYTFSVGLWGGILSTAMVFLLIMTFYTHVLIKQFKGEKK